MRLKRGVLLLASVLASLFIAEILLRSCVDPIAYLEHDPDREWTERLKKRLRESSEDGTTFGNVQVDSELGWRTRPMLRLDGQTTNSRGFRGSREHRQGDFTEGPRIVVVGDSFTYGFGVRDDETFCARMDERLPGVEVLNLGVNAYGTDQQYLFWLSEGMLYRPDIVILSFYLPNFHRNVLRVREFPKPWFELTENGLRLCGRPVPTPTEFLARHEAHGRSLLRLTDVASTFAHRLGLGGAPDSFDAKAMITKAIVEEMNTSVLDAGARLCIVVIPYRRIRAREVDGRIEQLLEEVATENRIPHLNLSEPLLENAAKAPDRPLYADHGHWTPEAHDLAAKWIVDFLRHAGLQRRRD